jgi:hypothetical protein
MPAVKVPEGREPAEGREVGDLGVGGIAGT